MFDLASRRGLKIDIGRLSTELGIRVVTSVAVQRGGTEQLLKLMDEPPPVHPDNERASWRPPSAAEAENCPTGG